MSPIGRCRVPGSSGRRACGTNRDVVGRAAAKRHGRRSDAAVAAFDLHERADRCLVHRHDDIVEREFLAVLLVAEPDAKSRPLEDHRGEHPAVVDARFEFLAQLQRRMLDRTLEGDEAVAMLDPDAQNLAVARSVVRSFGVEQSVRLEPARPIGWRARRCRSTAARAASGDSNRSLISRSSGVDMRVQCRDSAGGQAGVTNGATASPSRVRAKRRGRQSTSRPIIRAHERRTS